MKCNTKVCCATVATGGAGLVGGGFASVFVISRLMPLLMHNTNSVTEQAFISLLLAGIGICLPCSTCLCTGACGFFTGRRCFTQDPNRPRDDIEMSLLV